MGVGARLNEDEECGVRLRLLVAPLEVGEEAEVEQDLGDVDQEAGRPDGAAVAVDCVEF